MPLREKKAPGTRRKRRSGKKKKPCAIKNVFLAVKPWRAISDPRVVDPPKPVLPNLTPLGVALHVCSGELDPPPWPVLVNLTRVNDTGGVGVPLVGVPPPLTLPFATNPVLQ